MTHCKAVQKRSFNLYGKSLLKCATSIHEQYDQIPIILIEIAKHDKVAFPRHEIELYKTSSRKI